MNPAHIRHLIKKIEVDEEYTQSPNRIYIDFHDEERARFYIIFLPVRRAFGSCRKTNLEGMGMVFECPRLLRTYLISIIPPDIIARCTAASLGVEPD